MDQPTNTAAVDAALASQPQAPDHVQISAVELVNLRARAASAAQYESEIGSTLAKAALTEGLQATAFTDDVAAMHARTILQSRIVVKPGPDGRLAAVDRDTGRPAADVVREIASGPEFARYRPSVHQGGGGGGKGTSSVSPGSTDPAEARRAAIASTILKAKGIDPGGRTMGNPFGHKSA